MRDKQYNAAAVKFMFWLPEMQIVCDLLASGMTMKKVKAKNGVSPKSCGMRSNVCVVRL